MQIDPDDPMFRACFLEAESDLEAEETESRKGDSQSPVFKHKAHQQSEDDAP